MSLVPGSEDDTPSVRPATAADVQAVAAVQLRAWTRDYAEVLPTALLSALSAADLTAQWQEAVTRPPSPGHQVLVACSGATVVGFAARADDGEIVALWVDPAHQRHGHGSRLLAALADLARAEGLTSLSTWCALPDEPRRQFLTSAGFGADGALRDLEWDGSTLREARLVATLNEAG